MQRVQANIINISAVMSAMEKAHRWREACDLLSQSHAETLRPSTVSFSAAISAAEKGRAWWMALRLLEEEPLHVWLGGCQEFSCGRLRCGAIVTEANLSRCELDSRGSLQHSRIDASKQWT